MTTTNYIWDEENLLAESDATNTINVVYTNEPQQFGNLVSSRLSVATSYHHFDALGSTRQLTNAAGTTTDTVIYDAWGNVLNRTGATGAMLLWIAKRGYYSDKECSAIQVRRRRYDPHIVQWTTVDPLRFSGRLSPYAYAFNAPPGFDDPSGLAPFKITFENFVCKQCTTFDVTMLLQSSRDRGVTIVQYHCTFKGGRFCRDCDVGKQCCWGDIIKATNCCFYEAFPSNLGRAPDTWHGGFHLNQPILPPCTALNVVRGDSVFRAFVDKDNSLYDTIVATWNKPGTYECPKGTKWGTGFWLSADKEPDFWGGTTKDHELLNESSISLDFTSKCCPALGPPLQDTKLTVKYDGKVRESKECQTAQVGPG
jgi:RHS repeat-associated protein